MTHDNSGVASDYYDNLPDYRRLARDLGERAAVELPKILYNGRAFWKLTDADTGELAWLAFTRPNARSALDRRKVWTLIPHLREFLANWFVTVDHEITDQGRWVHTNIDIHEARELALLVPQPSTDDIKRITHPEAVLTLNDIDRYTVSTVLGSGTAQALKGRR
jgi:hypothetical protein